MGVVALGGIGIWVVRVMLGRRWDVVWRGACVFLYKWVCSVLRMVWGSDVISFVVGSLIDLRLGWSFAPGRRLAMIFKFWWYLFALFLCRTSSFLRRIYLNFLLALLVIVAVALLHNEGMSSRFGESVSCSIVAACETGLMSGRTVGGSVGHWDLTVCWQLTSFPTLVRRCICRLPDLVIGGRSFFGPTCVGDFATGHSVCAYLWYMYIIFMSCLAVLSICVVVSS